MITAGIGTSPLTVVRIKSSKTPALTGSLFIYCGQKNVLTPLSPEHLIHYTSFGAVCAAIVHSHWGEALYNSVSNKLNLILYHDILVAENHCFLNLVDCMYVMSYMNIENQVYFV